MAPTDGPVVQRACACGGTCAHCADHDEEPRLQPKLRVGAPHDRYEHEADCVTEQVLRMPEPLPSGALGGASPSIQRLSAETDDPEQTNVALPGGGARPLSAETRAYMEPRFGADFSGVRVHTGAEAARTSMHLDARAFTYGRDIWLGKGAGEGDRRLMAHELTHVVQQGEARGPGRVPGTPVAKRVQRRWDRATSECAGQPTDKWIERIVVQQETPQSVTVHWSDGTQESGQCSAGKGHCCVDPANPDGVACTQGGSTVNGSNCTPVTRRSGYLVKHRDLDHNGVLWWTEFVPNRGVALHEYAPVDGTPLSHGCVRLHHDMAVKIFCGVRQNQTSVQVQGFARPMCDHTALRNAWVGDFDWGGQDLSAHDGDADAQASIRETRRMLNAAFGRVLTVAEIRALGPDDIPRCTQTVERPVAEETESE